jgi:diguanylate cyclase (GGDEF)-like protein
MKLEDALQGLGQTTISAFGNINTAVDLLNSAARTSDLTGLPNSLAYKRDFANVHAREGKSCLLFGDLNGFKAINDTYGHEAGDAALQRTGKILALVAQNWHATAYHKSGDEFMVLVSSQHKAGLLKELGQYFTLVTFPFDGQRLEFSGSFGCVEIDMSNLQRTQERAELACRAAKRGGREYVVHEWSPEDKKIEESERRLRCNRCGTAFRCTLAGEHLNRHTLHCPVCGLETTVSATETATL